MVTQEGDEEKGKEMWLRKDHAKLVKLRAEVQGMGYPLQWASVFIS